jgi:hypothetical protein
VIVQGGVSEKLSGLTVGADYYVQADGSLASAGILPYSISGSTYVQSFSVGGQETSPIGIAFSTGGTKMFISGGVGQDVNEYSLSTAFDISTASYTRNYNVASQVLAPYGITFNGDGTKMYVVDFVGGQDVNEYSLSTGFNLSSVSYVRSFSVSGQATNPAGIAFNSDGTKMFVVGSTSADANEYSLSTGFNISTASYVRQFSLSSQETSPAGIAFNSDGTKMFVNGVSSDEVQGYALSTGFNIGTATFDESFSTAAQEANSYGLAFNDDGTKFYITGTDGDDVNQYSTTAASTTVPAGRALSTTSILLEG